MTDTLSLAELVEQLVVVTLGPTANIRVGKDIVQERARGASLLQQLHDSARGIGGGRQGTSAPAARESALVQGSALELRAKIVDEILDLYSAGVADPGPGLRARPSAALLVWWASFSAADRRGEITELIADNLRQQLQGWADQITATINPPRIGDLTIHCPACGQYRWVDTEGIEMQAVITKPDPDDGIVAWCRACTSVIAAGRVEIIALGRDLGIDVDSEEAGDRIRHALDDREHITTEAS